MKITTAEHPVNSSQDTLPPSELDDPVPPSRLSDRSEPEPTPLLDIHVETSDQNRVDRFSDRKRKAQVISQRFTHLGLENKGRKIGQCSDLIVKRKFSCGHSSLIRDTGKAHAFRCKDKFCPICNHVRSVKLSHRFGNALRAYVKAHGLFTYHLVLTFRNSDSLPDYKRIRRQARRLFNSESKARKEFWDRYGFHGALMNFEITVDRVGRYHPHFHILLLTERPIPLIETGKHEGEFQNSVNQTISDLWLKITKTSYIVKGSSFEFEGIFEMVKYMTKGIDKIPDGQLYDLAEWSEGKRFLSLIGGLYSNDELRELLEQGEGLHDPETCPICGCNEYADVPAWFDPVTGRYVEDCHDLERCLSPP